MYLDVKRVRPVTPPLQTGLASVMALFKDAGSSQTIQRKMIDELERIGPIKVLSQNMCVGYDEIHEHFQ